MDMNLLSSSCLPSFPKCFWHSQRERVKSIRFHVYCFRYIHWKKRVKTNTREKYFTRFETETGPVYQMRKEAKVQADCPLLDYIGKQSSSITSVFILLQRQNNSTNNSIPSACLTESLPLSRAAPARIRRGCHKTYNLQVQIQLSC